MKSFTSIILIIAGLLLFVFFTKPKFSELKAKQLEVKALNTATENAKSLETKKSVLLDIKNSISVEDRQKMEKMLPNNVENVKLIIDFDKMLQNLVEERGTIGLYKSTELTDTGSKKVSIENPKITPGAVGDTSYDNSRLGAINFSFSVSLTYADFLEFLQRIEHSTRILDVESVTFSIPPSQVGVASSDNLVYTFNITLKTYWLKYINDNKLQ